MILKRITCADFIFFPWVTLKVQVLLTQTIRIKSTEWEAILLLINITKSDKNQIKKNNTNLHEAQCESWLNTCEIFPDLTIDKYSAFLYLAASSRKAALLVLGLVHRQCTPVSERRCSQWLRLGFQWSLH